MSDIILYYDGLGVGDFVVLQDPNNLHTPVIGTVSEITIGLYQYYFRVDDIDIWYPYSSICEVNDEI